MKQLALAAVAITAMSSAAFAGDTGPLRLSDAELDQSTAGAYAWANALPGPVLSPSGNWAVAGGSFARTFSTFKAKATAENHSASASVVSLQIGIGLGDPSEGAGAITHAETDAGADPEVPIPVSDGGDTIFVPINTGLVVGNVSVSYAWSVAIGSGPTLPPPPP